MVEKEPNPPAAPRMLDAGNDERIENNTLRHKYRFLTESEKRQMLAVKDKGLELLELISSLSRTPGELVKERELEIAKTRTEEAVMWAVKHITA
jgi:hypothetical protein